MSGETSLDDVDRRLKETMEFIYTELKPRMDELEEENQYLRKEVATLRSVVDTDQEKVEYDRLTRDDKVHKIRTKLYEVAKNTNGKAAMDYNDVMKTFNGNPSPGHAFDLMELASEKDGFEYHRRDEENDRIVVETNAVKDEAAFHAANNRVATEGD